jgi:hypothetical protein
LVNFYDFKEKMHEEEPFWRNDYHRQLRVVVEEFTCLQVCSMPFPDEMTQEMKEAWNELQSLFAIFVKEHKICPYILRNTRPGQWDRNYWQKVKREGEFFYQHLKEGEIWSENQAEKDHRMRTKCVYLMQKKTVLLLVDGWRTPLSEYKSDSDSDNDDDSNNDSEEKNDAKKGVAQS